jgi:hypothetical protein
MRKTRFPKPRKWIPKNPEKYVGDITNIISRSSWETKFLNWADNNPAIISYSSEETVIPYISMADMKPHRYYPDFKIKVKDAQGNIKTYIVEIKPNSQRNPPIYKGKKTQKYINECSTFMVNQSKWKAAESFCKERGLGFIVLDEYDLGIAKRKTK